MTIALEVGDWMVGCLRRRVDGIAVMAAMNGSCAYRAVADGIEIVYHGEEEN